LLKGFIKNRDTSRCEQYYTALHIRNYMTTQLLTFIFTKHNQITCTQTATGFRNHRDACIRSVCTLKRL